MILFLCKTYLLLLLRLLQLPALLFPIRGRSSLLECQGTRFDRFGSLANWHLRSQSDMKRRSVTMRNCCGVFSPCYKLDEHCLCLAYLKAKLNFFIFLAEMVLFTQWLIIWIWWIDCQYHFVILVFVTFCNEKYWNIKTQILREIHSETNRFRCIKMCSFVLNQFK